MRTIAHGTCARVGRRILSTGLRPRGKRASLWGEHPSIANHVYLTSAYAFYFAQHALGEKDESGALIEVDLDLLDGKRLYPDEDVIAQGLLSAQNAQWGTELGDITRNVREQIHTMGPRGLDWKWSLETIGNCSHRGLIPVRAIKRVVLLHEADRPEYLSISDPTITALNYRILGSQYEATQAFLLGYPVDREELLADPARVMASDEWREQFIQRLDWIESRREIIYDRSER